MSLSRFHCRTAFLDHLYQHAPSPAIRRALRDAKGQVCVMGGFSEIPPHKKAGWICRVTSRHGRTWLLAVLADELQHVYRVVVIEAIPHTKWIGKTKQKGWNVYNGDVAPIMHLLRWEKSRG